MCFFAQKVIKRVVIMDKLILNDDLIANVNKFGEKVVEWNKMSLIARSTVDDLWGWHFTEAFSIVEILNDNNHLKFYDFGAGGGVLGIPLSYYGFAINLIERSTNKLFFLRNIIKYENVFDSVDDYSKSLVIVRGVSSVLDLLRSLNGVEKLVLFKSFNVKAEIEEALQFFNFKYELFHRVGRAKGYIAYLFDILSV